MSFQTYDVGKIGNLSMSCYDILDQPDGGWDEEAHGLQCQSESSSHQVPNIEVFPKRPGHMLPIKLGLGFHELFGVIQILVYHISSSYVLISLFVKQEMPL